MSDAPGEKEPIWLALPLVHTLHAETLSQFGGSAGVRDEGLLESALGKPQNVFAYAEAPSLFRLAAAYCSGIVRNHPFVDGNKRTGLLAARAFLFLNGYTLSPESEAETVRMIEDVATGDVDEDALAAWMERSSQPRGA